nr:immunoglobulin heavy chain junction region [Macaca mulatta]MOX03259.1 immunoglobulin heavy chain junction region [Macaca mulatta]MOX03544.1 immunoglobulin heavy chain junction region [Macaca mulatta]MOX05629.1 immunoglobulin heavy chain junction region [Macaca mulatta]
CANSRTLGLDYW